MKRSIGLCALMLLVLPLTLYSYNCSGVNTHASYTCSFSPGVIVTYDNGSGLHAWQNPSYWWNCNAPGAAGGELWNDLGACSAEPAVSTTDPPSAVSSSSMTLRGNVTNRGGSDIIERGFIYGTNSTNVSNSTPTSLQGNSIVVTQTGTTGVYTKVTSGLCPGTTYYFKAYAINSTDIGYGTVENETTTLQGTYTTTQNGAFTDAATWGGCGPPNLAINNSINIGHSVTSSGMTISEGTDIIITSGGNFTAGAITMSGTGSITTFTVNSGGTATVSSIEFTSASNVTNAGNLTINGQLTINAFATFATSGTTNIGYVDNNSGDFLQTAGTVNISGSYDCANDCNFDQNSGDMTVNGNFVVWGSGESHMDGTLSIYGTITMDNNGYMDGAGLLTYANSNVNPNNSGSYIGCSNGTRYDDNPLSAWTNLKTSTWDLNICSGTLPVELVEFYLKNNSETTILYWTTASEINNEYFEIETSNDGINWITDGRVEGMGNSVVLNYYAYQSNSDNMYFRLKQVDFDGTHDYSNIIVSLNYKNKNTITSNRDLIVVHSEDEYIVSIYKSDGGLIYEKEHQGTAFINKNQFNHGIYVVKVGSEKMKICVYND